MNSYHFMKRFGFAIFALIVMAWDVSFAKAGEHEAQDLGELSLEELMDVEVTSVSKKKQRLGNSAAAIFVITQEDIRRSGVTSIPEALRMVPGLEVARQDSNKWAITARGFNLRFSNKLLVLVDGRNVYNSLFAGTVWETIDTMLEDIDRIEVIRGPGGTLWGVNAVNGVINIITKKSKETQGGLVSGIVGSREGIGGVRYGGKTDYGLNYRVFAKYLSRDTNFHSAGAHDDWGMVRTGFRSEWEATSKNTITVLGEAYDQSNGQRITLPIATAPAFATTFDENAAQTGGHLLIRLDRKISDESNAKFQFFYDRFETEQATLRATIDTLDFEAQHRFRLPFGQEIVWGGEYRYWADQISGSFTLTPVPSHQSFNLVSGFIQDEITLMPEELWLTFGNKFSHNHFTGFEYQPSGRALWRPNPRHSIWAAASRAVRVPSRLEDQGAIISPPVPPTLPVPVNIVGNQQLGSEILHSFEVGYRVAPDPRVSFDITAFYNIYDNLGGSRAAAAIGGFPSFQIASNKEARNYGIEIAGTAQLLDWWKVKGTYTHFEMDVDVEAASGGLPDTSDGGSPRHQASVRSMMNFPHDVEFDTWLRFVDELPSLGIPGYVELDVRLGWQPWAGVDVSFVGQNLLDKHHPEMSASFLQTQATEVPRSFYGKVTWSFESLKDTFGK